MSNFTLEKIDSQSLWRGHPDTNYSWNGGHLSWERIVKDEEGKDKLVKTYRDAIEITADFQAESKVYGIASNVEKNTVDKFHGALKGFIWVDNISGGGKVVLPFTAPHIFIATGERLNPVLTEIGTSGDNYYEVVEGKTHVHVKAFSGVGGAAGSPPTLIAHYKMNENTASDNDELVTNGNFAGWTADNPDSWTVVGESGNDPEISEAATGEAHADTPTLGGGMCNLYTSDGTLILVRQTITLVVGRKYRVSINVDTVTTGGIAVYDGITGTVDDMFTLVNYTTTGTKTFVFVATRTSLLFSISRQPTAAADVTFDDVSLKLCAAEDSSGNDHDMLMQQDTDAISVAGKINRAFDFGGVSDYGEIADHDDLTPAGTPFSISVWVYMHDATSFYIASKGVYNTDAEWLFRVYSDDKLGFLRYDESVDNCYIGRRYDTAITAYENQWIHLVATSDGGTLSSGDRLYINGERVDDINQEVNAGSFVAVENLNHAVWIGRYSTSHANGLIGNMMFFSKELTQDEVKRIYNNGHGTEVLAEVDSVITPRRSNTSPLGLRARYEFP